MNSELDVSWFEYIFVHMCRCQDSKYGVFSVQALNIEYAGVRGGTWGYVGVCICVRGLFINEKKKMKEKSKKKDWHKNHFGKEQKKRSFKLSHFNFFPRILSSIEIISAYTNPLNMKREKMRKAEANFNDPSKSRKYYWKENWKMNEKLLLNFFNLAKGWWIEDSIPAPIEIPILF